jgi:hypothetical protein
MRISYRVVSCVVLTTFLSLYVIGLLFDKALVPAATVAEPGVVQFNVCTMWEQIPATVRLSTIASFVTALILLVQGSAQSFRSTVACDPVLSSLRPNH